MKIDKIMSFLTYPGKHIKKQPAVNGAEIPKAGKIYDMLLNIFEESENNCDIPICFNSGGSQDSLVRDEIVRLVSTKSMDDGKVLSERLQCSTTEKSGKGLVFFIIGSSGEYNKIVISRFPAQEGILAEKHPKYLKVEHKEQVFIKNPHSYKSAMYKFKIPNYDLWTGYAVDRQMNHTTTGIAAYWINDFLRSKCETTSKMGTERLAKALQNAIAKTNNMEIKEEIVSCANLANNFSNKKMSINQLCDQFRLSIEAKKQVISQVSPARLSDDVFLLNKIKFDQRLLYKMIELDNGAILSAPAARFDECFKSSKMAGNGNKKYVTSGKVVDEKLRGFK